MALARGFPRVGFPTTSLCDVRTFLERREALRDCLACAPDGTARTLREVVRGAGLRAAPAGTARRPEGGGSYDRPVAPSSRTKSAFRSFVRKSDDRRLERAFGTRGMLRVVFGRVARAYDPSKAPEAEGDLAFVLRDGNVAPEDQRVWTVHLAPTGATVSRGAPAAPLLTIRASLPDLVRMAAGELSPGRALLSGRLDLDGSFLVVVRLAPAFGVKSPL